MVFLADWRKPAVIAVRAPAWDVGAIADDKNVWEELRFLDKPDARQAKCEFDSFVSILNAYGIALQVLDPSSKLSPDAVYVRDAACLTPKGLFACGMTKANRCGEPDEFFRQLAAHGYPCVGAIQPPGHLEGGDVVWMTDNECLIGRSYRSNEEGIRQFRNFCGDGTKTFVFDLPNELGADHVFHLSSIISFLSPQICLAQMRYLPVSLAELLGGRGIRIVEMPDEEAISLGANVLVLDHETVLLVAGNARTSARIRDIGLKVVSFPGDNLCILGQGGPTCLTRPLAYL